MAYIFNNDIKIPTINWLPLSLTGKKGEQLHLRYFSEGSDLDTCRKLLNFEISSWETYPFSQPMDSTSFKSYFTSHSAFVLEDLSTQKIVGTFYIKPNFPGRCSHICNGGFIVPPTERRKGLGELMGSIFPFLARELNFKASMFNLVFKNNPGSIELWKKLGLREIGVIPDAAQLKEGGYSDAIQFYWDFSTLPDKNPFLL